MALAGVEPAQIAAGLQETLALGLEWPPTAPRFRAMCMGIPSIAQVRHELKYPSEKRTPFMRQVWAYMDMNQYNTGDEYRFDRAVNEAYELACRHVLTGQALPPTPIAVIGVQKRAKPVPASDEVMRDQLNRMADILGEKRVGAEAASAV